MTTVIFIFVIAFLGGWIIALSDRVKELSKRITWLENHAHYTGTE